MRIVMLSASALIAIIAVALAVGGYLEATGAPVVRHLVIRTADYPSAAAPLTIALLSDLHVHGPDMPPARVGRIVDEVNALQPDIDIIAGDFVGGNLVGARYPIGEAIAPLARLNPRLGVYAVLGNNDYEAGGDAVAGALGKYGVHVLINEAASVGPLALGGVDGKIFIPRPEWSERREKTYSALRHTPGVKLLIAHRPDEFRSAPSWVKIVLAGHTHCGQIVLPVIGPIATGSDFGREYLCGEIRDRFRILIVTAGLGTSHLPLRIGAPPDLWLIRIEGKGR